MNGGASFEPEYSEFVELDPTGRYGRVCITPFLLIFSFLLFFSVIYTLKFFILILGIEFHVWQYNEILGKGASKTVYVHTSEFSKQNLQLLLDFLLFALA